MDGLRGRLERALHVPGRTLAPDGRREAAVAAIVTGDGRLWFVQRAEHPSDPWSGHLAFPGGKRSGDDLDLRATAVRETLEEVGVDLSRAPCLGTLDDLEARPVRTLCIRPFVFWLDAPPSWAPNVEIHCMVDASLDALCAGVGRQTFRWPYGLLGVELPCIMLGERRLWGLTLRMVDDLVRRMQAAGLCSDPLQRL